MDSQYKLLSELLSDQAAFITSPKTSLANYWGGALPPSVYGPVLYQPVAVKIYLDSLFVRRFLHSFTFLYRIINEGGFSKRVK